MPQSLSRSEWFIAIGTFAVCMAFALYTGHAWEDWYITFKASKNLATGNGLGYMPGEPVHSFTSVIGTLIPALLSLVTFNVSDDLVLWLYRILNAGVMAATAILLVRCSGRWFAGLAPATLLVGGVMIDAKTVDFAINGMETPYTLFGLALFFYFTAFHPVSSLKVKLGVVWALLEYARPDGFIFVLLLMAGLLLFQSDRRETLKTIVISGLIALALFAPWLLFATWYYGSPVPHSIIAKGALSDFGAGTVLEKTGRFLTDIVLFRRSVLDDLFMPPYSIWFDMPAWKTGGRIVAFIAIIVWTLPGVKPAGRIASFSLLGFLWYQSVYPPFVYPWYLPGATLLGFTALALALDALPGLAGRIRNPLARFAPGPRAVQAGVGLMLGAMVILTLITAQQVRLLQTVIEDNHRTQIGLWLRHNAESPGETLFLECAGYIGFHSGLKTYDYPGMTSPEMVRARKTLQTRVWVELIKELRPDWLVLRYNELDRVWNSDSVYMKRNYAMVKVFNASQAISRIRFMPYKEYFLQDNVFAVCRRIPPSGPLPGAIRRAAIANGIDPESLRTDPDQ
jgi:hypothetical protein